jgi:hypothetical protein
MGSIARMRALVLLCSCACVRAQVKPVVTTATLVSSACASSASLSPSASFPQIITSFATPLDSQGGKMLVEIYNGTMTTGSPPIASGESKYGGHGTAAITKFGGSVVTFHGGTTGWSECTASVRPSASLTPTSNIVCRVGWTNLDHTLSGFTIPCSAVYSYAPVPPHRTMDMMSNAV